MINLLDAENTKEEVLSREQAVEEAKETPKTPELVAIGDEKIAIMKHDIYRKGGEGDTTEAIGIELAVKNVSDTVIGSVLFEAVLYDMEGNILDTVEHKTIELRPNASRTLRINYSGPKSDKVRSYCVRVVKTTLTPEPTAIGDERINILKHSLIEPSTDDYGQTCGIDLAIRNVCGVTIASVILETAFYDIEGNIIETVKHKEIDLKPDTSRRVTIFCSKLGDSYKIRSYNARIARSTTTDVEKVQLRRHEIRTTDTGEEEVRGIVKNISSVKTDVALVATFFNPKKENIGVRVIVLRDIEPNNIRQFHFLFNPQEGDIVRTYTLNVGEIADSCV